VPFDIAQNAAAPDREAEQEHRQHRRRAHHEQRQTLDIGLDPALGRVQWVVAGVARDRANARGRELDVELRLGGRNAGRGGGVLAGEHQAGEGHPDDQQRNSQQPDSPAHEPLGGGVAERDQQQPDRRIQEQDVALPDQEDVGDADHAEDDQAAPEHGRKGDAAPFRAFALHREADPEQHREQAEELGLDKHDQPGQDQLVDHRADIAEPGRRTGPREVRHMDQQNPAERKAAKHIDDGHPLRPGRWTAGGARGCCILCWNRRLGHNPYPPSSVARRLVAALRQHTGARTGPRYARPGFSPGDALVWHVLTIFDVGGRRALPARARSSGGVCSSLSVTTTHPGARPATRPLCSTPSARPTSS